MKMTRMKPNKEFKSVRSTVAVGYRLLENTQSDSNCVTFAERPSTSFGVNLSPGVTVG